MSCRSIKLGFLLVSLLFYCMSLSAATIEEITVTATKRGEQVLQDVPAAIQAFTGDSINDAIATEFSELAPMVPSL